MKPKDTSEHYILSSSPHAHADASTSRIMLDVIIALLPALCCGVYFFGLRALQPYLGYEVGFDAATNTAQIIINAE